MQGTLGLIPSIPTKLGVLAHAYNPSSGGRGKRIRIQGHPWLLTKLEVRKSYSETLSQLETKIDLNNKYLTYMQPE